MATKRKLSKRSNSNIHISNSNNSNIQMSDYNNSNNSNIQMSNSNIKKRFNTRTLSDMSNSNTLQTFTKELKETKKRQKELEKNRAIIHAIRCGDFLLVKELLEKMSNKVFIKYIKTYLEEIFYTTSYLDFENNNNVSNNFLSIIKLLLNRTSNNFIKTIKLENNNTLLIEAARKNTAVLSKLLLEFNSDSDYIQMQNYDGNTALIYAILNRNEKLIKLLLDKDPSSTHLKIKNNDGNTAIIIAIRGYSMNHQTKMEPSIQIIQVLLNYIENIEDVEANNSENFILKDIIELGYRELLQRTLNKISNLNYLYIKNKGNRTVLQDAICYSSNYELIQLLVEKDPSLEHLGINCCGDEKKTSLILAAELNNINIVKILLNNNSSKKYIRSQDINGNTALIYASQNNNIELVKLLVNKDPKPEHILIRNKDDMDALSFNPEIKIYLNEILSYKASNFKNYDIFQKYISVKSDKDILTDLKNFIETQSKNHERTDIDNIHLKFFSDLKPFINNYDNNLQFTYNIRPIVLNQDLIKKNKCLKLIIEKINENKTAYLFRLVVNTHANFGGGPLKEFFFRIQEELKLIGYYKILCKKIDFFESKKALNTELVNTLSTLKTEKENILSEFSDIEDIIDELDNYTFWNIIHLSNFNVSNYTQYIPYLNDTNIILNPYIFYAMKDISIDFFKLNDSIDETTDENFNNIIINFCFLLLFNIFQCKKNGNTYENNESLLQLSNIFSDEKLKMFNKLETDEEKKEFKNDYMSLDVECENVFFLKKNQDFIKSIIISNTITANYISEIYKIIKYNIDLEPISNDDEGIKLITDIIHHSNNNTRFPDLLSSFTEALVNAFNEENKYVRKFVRVMTGSENKPYKIEINLTKINPKKNKKREIYFPEYHIHTCFNKIDLSIEFFYHLKTDSEDTEDIENIQYLYDLYENTSEANTSIVVRALESNFTKLSPEELKNKIIEKYLMPELEAHIGGGNINENSGIILNNVILSFIVLVSSFLQTNL